MSAPDNLQLLAKFRFALMDMDGVLYRGNTALPGLVELFAFLEKNRIGYLLLTNNASMSAQDYSQKLLKMGVKVDAEKIITSSFATAQYLKQIAPEGGGIYVVGMEALRRALFGLSDSSGPFYFDDKNPRFVVQGADFNLVYATLKRACLLIRAGARFIATNGDPAFPSEEGLLPGAGSISALLQTATGQKPFVIGKPEPTMYKLALEMLGATLQETVMIGDNLITDIEGARRMGIPSILLLTGVTSAEDIAQDPGAADFVFSGLPELIASWQGAL